MNTTFEKTMENFREYLKKSGHNIVAENIKGSATGFICESLTSDKRFILKIRVDENLEYAVLEAYPGISIPKPYRTMAMEYCMRKTDERKVSYLAVDYDQGDVYAHTEAPFRDGALSGETLHEMERMVFSVLMSCYDDLQQIARGVLLDNEDKDESKLDLLSRLYKDMAADDEDDDSENDCIHRTPNIDIADILKQLEDDVDNPDEEIA